MQKSICYKITENLNQISKGYRESFFTKSMPETQLQIFHNTTLTKELYLHSECLSLRRNNPRLHLTESVGTVSNATLEQKFRITYLSKSGDIEFQIF